VEFKRDRDILGEAAADAFLAGAALPYCGRSRLLRWRMRPLRSLIRWATAARAGQ
jgi:hypothetical protein